MKYKKKILIILIFLFIFSLINSVSATDYGAYDKNDLNSIDIISDKTYENNLNYVDAISDKSDDNIISANNYPNDDLNENNYDNLHNYDTKNHLNKEVENSNEYMIIDDDAQSDYESENCQTSAIYAYEKTILSEGNVITVEHTGNDVLDLQNAIDSARSGDIIELGDHTYQISIYQIYLDKPLTLMGNGQTTIFNGTGGTSSSGCILSVSASSSSIIGIIFNDTQAKTEYSTMDTLAGWAVDMYDTHNMLIENCSFYNFNRAINIESGSNITIKNSYFNGSATRITNGNGKEYGSKLISISYAPNIFISNNTFEGPVLEAVQVEISSNVHINGNKFINNSYSLRLDTYYAHGTYIYNNTFYNCGHYENEDYGINFQALPVITKIDNEDIKIFDNRFYVSNGNLLVLASSGADSSIINVTNNTVLKINEEVNASSITFVQVFNVTKDLTGIGKVEISSNNLLEGMESLVMVDYIWYSEDGDVFIPLNSNCRIEIFANDSFSGNPFNITFTLKDLNDAGLNDVFINFTLDNKRYSVLINDGVGTIEINDTIEPGNYPIVAKFLGSGDYNPAIAYNVISVYSKSTFRILQTIIDDAEEGSVIYLSGLYESEGNAVLINKPLTIRTKSDESNSPAILDGKFLSGIFIVNAPNVTIKDIIFMNSGNAGYGGAISVNDDADNVSVSNCTFINNTANMGADIAWSGENGRLYDSNFFYSNALRGSGGSIAWDGRNGILNNCTFTGASSKSAGAITWSGINGIVDNSTFINNRATDIAAGAIYWNGINGSLLNSIFANNSAFTSGGAVYWNIHNGTIKNCTFNNNHVTNPEGSSGGAIYWSGNNGRIIDSEFNSNHIISELSSDPIAGGAILWVGNNGTVINSTFINNSVTADGFMEDVFGGAIYWNGTDGHLIDSVFMNNSVGIFMGGAVYWESDSASINNCTFIANSAYSGGAVCIAGEGSSLINSSFLSNDATEGGAIYWEGDNGTLLDSRFINNTAIFGTVSWDGSYGLVDKCSFISNRINENSSYNGIKSSGVYWYGKNGTVSNTIFDDAKNNIEAYYGKYRPNDSGNFWGINFNSSNEIINSKLINHNGNYVSPNSWIRIKMEGPESIERQGTYDYFAYFISNNGDELTAMMPDYEVNASNLLKSNALESQNGDNNYIISSNSLNLKYHAILNGNETIYLFNSKDPMLCDISLDANLDDVNTQINSSSNYSVVNESFKFNLTVKDENGNDVNYGKILIYIDNNPLGVYNLTNGSVIDDYVFDEEGIYLIRIFYSGENVYLKSNYSFNVTVFNASVKLVSHTGDDLRDLQQAIDSAQDGDTIFLGYHDYVNVSGAVISKNLIFNGTGASITGSGDGKPIFIIPPISQGGPQNITFSGFDFNANNGDILVLVNTDDGESSPKIINSAVYVNDISLKEKEGLMPSTITIIQLNSNSDDLELSREISLFNNDFIDGITTFKFNIEPLNNGSDFVIPAKNENSDGSAHEDTVRSPVVISCKSIKVYAVNIKTDGKNAGRTFSITLKSSGGKVLAGKQVIMSINGKIYKRTTNAKGIAIIKISISKKGTYPIVVSFLGDNQYNGSFVLAKVKVNPQKVKLSVPKKTYKASKKTKYLTATLKNSKGKAIKGKKVIFKVNGRKYTAKTNKKGIAKTKVKLSRKKTYKVTVKFAGDSTFKKATKKGKVRIV